MDEVGRIDTVARGINLESVVFSYAYRGIWVQLALRAMLLLFIALTLFFVPPAKGSNVCLIILFVYMAWSLLIALWTWHGGDGPVKYIWLTLLVDLIVFAGLTLLSGIKSQESWTATVFINGLILLPLLASMQLNPRLCVGVVAPTVIVFLLASWLAFDNEPWSVILLTTMMMGGLGVGAVSLSSIQKSRVRTIGDLVTERTRLLSELVTLEQRERQRLSEQLHDGVLQYVLAARQDLIEYQIDAKPLVLNNISDTLRQVSDLLRTTVAELHPAVLEHVGLPRAIYDLANSSKMRGNFEVVMEISWPDRLRTSVDGLLFSVSRELLNNIVKHSNASNVFIELRHEEKSVMLRIEDDGRGISPSDLDQSLADGHIGIASYTLRVAAAGGSLTIRRGSNSGTVACINVPYVEIPFEAIVRPFER